MIVRLRSKHKLNKAHKHSTRNFHFEVVHRSSKSRARAGILHTEHGSFNTPSFVPVGTTGTIKGVTFDQAAQEGVKLVFCNTYHLLVYPGPDIVERSGGIHKMNGHKGPIITDSGGFQIFSLSNTVPQDELKGKVVKNVNNLVVKLNEDGVIFRSYRNGDKIHLTPESSVQAQKKIGADIILPLDHLLPNSAGEKKLLRAMEMTHRWEKRSLDEHLKNPNNQAMYSILHGGTNFDLRKQSLDYLNGLNFDGLAIGGSLGKDTADMNNMLTKISTYLPTDKPVHLLGIGDIPGISSSLQHGIDTFDSCYPTRCGRHGTVFSRDGPISLNQGKFLEEIDKPIDRDCECYTCKNYSRSYIHQLFKHHESVGGTLATIHNLHYMMKMMERYRQMILENEI
eukprot:TRINITY_DN3825_c0_g1_i2.p1 TRINITY_DN3825_c0_g1~~TRINITY_DN3825_c0_g1_i2.p1  ORF type:complete len:396 (-),score=69.46 TRINITY_DN3825_c0_g1_i2:36-1223(-)